MVEAQHRISTGRLVSDPAAQALLEDLAEEVKPTLPARAAHLDYLLASPFRYGNRQASRFRRADERPGIFYASEAEATAIAEIAYWRLRFFSRSPGFVAPSTTSEHSSFSVLVASQATLDLTMPPFESHEADWIDPADYTDCQDFASVAREAARALIRTLSARDPERGCNVVVLDPAAFSERRPKPGRTWHLRFENDRLVALAAFPAHDRFEFTAAGFGL